MSSVHQTTQDGTNSGTVCAGNWVPPPFLTLAKMDRPAAACSRTGTQRAPRQLESTCCCSNYHILRVLAAVAFSAEPALSLQNK